jgi:hypothetical protein
VESVIGPDRTQQLANGAEHEITAIPDLRIIERDFEKPEHGNQQECFEGFNRDLSPPRC